MRQEIFLRLSPLAYILVLAGFVHWLNYIKITNFSSTNWLILIGILPMVYASTKTQNSFITSFGKQYFYYILFFLISLFVSIINLSFIHKSFFQNSFIYFTFFIVLFYTSRYVQLITTQFIHRVFGIMFFLLVLWACQGLYAYGLDWGNNNNVLYRPIPIIDGRSLALVMLLLISWYISYFIKTLRYRYFFIALFGATVIFLSLSRVALIMALLIIILGIFKTSRLHKRIAIVMLVLTLSLWSFATILFETPLQDRYLGSYTISFQETNHTGKSYYKDLGPLKLDTSGRSELWSTTFESFKEAPLFGKGIGSSEVELLRRLPSYGQSLTCNDHLRILHDTGVIGYGLIMLQVFIIIKKILMRLKIEFREEKILFLNHAFFSLLIVVMMGITENILLFSYVMLPLAIILGLIYEELKLDNNNVPLGKYE